MLVARANWICLKDFFWRKKTEWVGEAGGEYDIGKRKNYL